MSTVNIAFQILPTAPTKEEAYKYVDIAIKVIQTSGLKYEVCPFETVIEGEYEAVMQVIKTAQDACLNAGCTHTLANLKIQRSKDADVKIEDKIGKYRS